MKTTDYSQLIEKYHYDQMSETEKQEFENQAMSNPSLAEEIKIQKDLFELANDEDFKTFFPKMKAAENEYLRTQSKRSSSRLSLVKPIVFALLLLLIIIACLAIVFQ